MNKFYKKYNLKPVINVAGTMTSIGASIINERSLSSVEEIHDKFIYIGDTEFDIQCAQNANVDFLFANWGYGSTTKDIKKIDNVEEFTNLIIGNL